MPITYENISTTTLNSPAAAVTFSSIPATFTDLRVVITGTSTTASQNVFGTFNSDSGTNYSTTRLSGSGTSATSDYRQNDVWLLLNTQGTSTTVPFTLEIDVMSYTAANWKTTLVTTNENRSSSAGGVSKSVYLYRSNSAITAISLFPSGGNFDTATTATLYGIKNA
jgi:hypothetical protein